MSLPFDERKRALKEMIRQLHSGAAPQEVKQKFKQVLSTVSPLEISRIEQELVREGMPQEEIHRLCDVHLLVFQDQLEKQKPTVPTENPVNILMEEHKIMLQLAETASKIATNAQRAKSLNEISHDLEHLKHIAQDFIDSEKHYVREENVLFPMIEKHGITEPPAIMWSEHDQIRPAKKQFCSLIENCGDMEFQDFRTKLAESAESLNSLLSSHFFKENNILFPTALQVITETEWQEVKREFDEIGYCRFTPQYLIAKPTTAKIEKAKPEATPVLGEFLSFETGMLPKDGAEALFKTLPIDVTFIDEHDVVRYFNKSDIFMRTKAILGRKVQQCHPQKSIHLVNEILDSFKTGKQDVAEFWAPVKGRLIHIRYFAVRYKNRKYLGTVEVTQDITDIKRIEGEKRLLDWKG